MKVIINKKELISGLKTVKNVVTNQMATFSSQIKLKGESEKMILIASDAKTSVKCEITSPDYECIQEGEVIVPGNIFYENIKLALDDKLTIEANEKECILYKSKGKIKLRVMKIKDYPNIIFDSNPKSSFEIESKMLEDAIDKTLFAVSKKDTRPVLTGVNFSIKNGSFYVIATDSYRLSRIEYPNFKYDKDSDITIPASTLKIIKDIILSDGKADDCISISIEKTCAIFKKNGENNIVVRATLLDGGYPETSKLIPKDCLSEFKISVPKFKNIIESGMFLKNEGFAIFTFYLSEKECRVISKSVEVGEFNEQIDAEYKGEDLKVSLTGEYILDALKAIESDNCIVKLNGELKPLLICDEDNENITELMIPVKTYN